MVFDYADAINRALTMREVAEHYGFKIHRGNKIICPFHNDLNASLVIYPGNRGYYCYSCNAGGDVIDFVKRLFNLDFKDACRKIDQDFCLRLGVGDERSREEREAAERAFRERMEQKKRREQKRKFLFCLYHAAYNRYAFLDILKRENAPTDPNKPVSKEYIYACKHIDKAWQDVEVAAERIRKFEEKEED